MDTIYRLPRSAWVGRMIPKNKFYQVLEANERVKRFFIDYIERITLQYKLSAETSNLTIGQGLTELHVFEIQLRQQDYPRKLIECIEKAIPYPMLHVMRYEQEVQQVIAYKVPHAQREGEWVMQALYASPWQVEQEVMITTEGAHSLKGLYDTLVKKWMPIVQDTSTTADELQVEQWFEKQQSLDRLNKEISKLEAKLRNEKQFHKKVPIHTELQRLKAERARIESV
jgi:hypothetical protein